MRSNRALSVLPVWSLRIKRRLDTDLVYMGKEDISQILRMLVGLRKSWAKTTQIVREDHAEYNPSHAGFDKACNKEESTKKPRSYKKGD